MALASRHADAGFTLAEVIVATGLLAVSLVAAAVLFVIAIRNTSIAGNSAFTAILAVQKMEQLRALTWAFDSQGLPVTDPSLTSSAPNTLQEDTDGYVDYLDVTGRSLGGGPAAPAGTAYVRRWSIDPLESSPDRTLVIQVLVRRLRGRDAGRSTMPSPEEAKLLTVKTRKY